MSSTVIFILEIIGTVAFAVSGANVAAEKKMDLLGVVILGLTTAVGGGIIRDLILGNTPPNAFVNPVYGLVAIGVSLIVFIPVVRKWLNRHNKGIGPVLLISDSLGLAIFTIVGISVAYEAIPDGSFFLKLFVGVVTGVGGGVMRDVMAGEMPAIFVRHFYACASIIGGIVCLILWHFFGSVVATTIGAATIVILRILAAQFKWKLPKA